MYPCERGLSSCPRAQGPGSVDGLFECAEMGMSARPRSPSHPPNCSNQARKNASSYGGDVSKFFTIGGSAGGGLALSIASRIVASEATRAYIKGIVAIVPLTLHPDNVPAEYASDYKSYTENATNVPIIDRESMNQFYEYTGVSPTDSSYFTLLDTSNLKNYPPTYITTCEFDPLRDDGKLMAKALKSNGVAVKEDYWEGFPHVSPSSPLSLLFCGCDEMLVARRADITRGTLVFLDLPADPGGAGLCGQGDRGHEVGD